jgi:hypothetical protein
LRWDAALDDLPGPSGRKGRPPKKGKRLPTPRAMSEDGQNDPAHEETIAFPKLQRRLRIQGVREILW